MARRKTLKRFPNTEQCPVSGMWRFNKIQNKGKPDEIWYRSKCEHESSEAAWLALQQRIKEVAEYGAQAVAAARAVPTFAELAAEWINKVVPASCKPSTAADYRAILDRHLLPALGSTPADRITRWDVKNLLLLKLNSGLASSTVNHIKNAMSGVLSLAVDSELLQANPAMALGKLWRTRVQDDDINPYSEAEVQGLLKALKENWPWYYPFVATLALAGLRLGEASALQWEDVDYANNVLHIRHSITRGVLGTPKSGKTRRVDMAVYLAEILQEHQLAMKRETLARGWGKMPRFVFVSQVGTPMDTNHFRRRVWNKALEKAKVPARRIHDLRHTWITLRIANGDNPADVSAQVGHHSVKFTLDRYYHWLPSEGTKAEVNDLAARLCAKV